MKMIFIGIYLFGVAMEVFRIIGQWELYKLYSKLEVIIDMIWVILWPAIWLRNFIDYYLHGPKDFMK